MDASQATRADARRKKASHDTSDRVRPVRETATVPKQRLSGRATVERMICQRPNEKPHAGRLLAQAGWLGRAGGIAYLDGSGSSNG